MEASSPLAALHRPMAPPTWGGRDIFRSHPHSHYIAAPPAGPVANLREQFRSSDYFSPKDFIGSSPAASLAADLSQNFRLDNEASPKFPTPRRALFTATMIGGLDGRGMTAVCSQFKHAQANVNPEFMTTPPLPPSSPALINEHMEVSPLPHKTPAGIIDRTSSPSPTSTPGDEEMILDSPAPIARHSSEPLRPSFAERRIAAPRRPSLTRMKGHTFSAGSDKPLPDRLPTFRFAGDSANSSSLSLGECFESESPQPMARQQQPSDSPCAPIPLGIRSRPQFLQGGSSRQGSPMNFHARRQSNPFLRNRKQMRRSLSMFEHPADIMKPKTQPAESRPSTLKCVMDVEESGDPALPHFFTEDPTDTIPRITKETMLEVLDGKFADRFDQKMVIDCRFEYEYNGGHIDGAVNYNNKELLTSQLFNSPMSNRTLLIFHCEYSAHRAPLMARHIRAEDRTANAEFYPRLTYPEVYILDGGYSGFFAEFRSRCFPPEYVEMSDEKHQRTCEREMGRLKSRKGLNRAQTFAFGQRESCVDQSPTAPSRPASRQTNSFAFGSFSPMFSGDRSHARRMASY